MAASIWSLCEDCDLSLKRSPLLKYLVNMPEQVEKSNYTPAPSKVLKQAGATVVTPIVSQVAEQLFNNPFRVIGEPQEAEVVAEAIANVEKEHNQDPTSIIWGTPSKYRDNYFESVQIDGVEYWVGSLSRRYQLLRWSIGW